MQEGVQPPRFTVDYWLGINLYRVIDRETGEVVMETHSAVIAHDEAFRLNHHGKQVPA